MSFLVVDTGCSAWPTVVVPSKCFIDLLNTTDMVWLCKVASVKLLHHGWALGVLLPGEHRACVVQPKHLLAEAPLPQPHRGQLRLRHVLALLSC